MNDEESRRTRRAHIVDGIASMLQRLMLVQLLLMFLSFGGFFLAARRWLSSTAQTEKRYDELLETPPGIRIFLKPIAPPAALGLAGFAGSTFIAASWIADWWGTNASPTTFFPFVGVFGGLAQFIAGLYGFAARDTLVTVVNTMWGSFWIALGILWGFEAAGALPTSSIHMHNPALAAWFVPLMAFTWSAAIASTARDVTLMVCLFSLAIGTTLACGLFGYNDADDPIKGGVTNTIKAAAYFWMLSALAAWWRVTVYLIEEAYGPHHPISKLFPILRTTNEKQQPYVIPGIGEPGVTRGVPKVLPVH